GAMGLRSALGEGSTFWFDLPLATGAESAKTSGGAIPQPYKPVHALVVEDDRFNQTVARRLLERAGCRVTVAENGRDGLSAIEHERPDIVFMDIQMPIMDGLEASRQIRASEKAGGRLPIVGLTASSVASSRTLCLEAGMDGYLLKPIQLQALIDTLQSQLPGSYT
ncbi:MAG: response regulator, partial [Myxococcota bacterium]